MTICTHEAQRRTLSDGHTVWCGECDNVVELLNGRWQYCACFEIKRADKTRHFRGCPLREKYPAIDLSGVHLRAFDLAKSFVAGWSTPHGWQHLDDAQMINVLKSHMVQFYIAENKRSLSEAETEEHNPAHEAEKITEEVNLGVVRERNALLEEVQRLRDTTRHLERAVAALRERSPTEKADMPGPIVMEFLAWFRGEMFDGIKYSEDETICAEFFAQRIEAKREGVTGDRRCQHVERVGAQLDPRQCTRSEGHAGPHQPSPVSEPLPSNRNCGGRFRWQEVDGGRASRCDKCGMWSMAGIEHGDVHNGVGLHSDEYGGGRPVRELLAEHAERLYQYEKAVEALEETVTMLNEHMERIEAKHSPIEKVVAEVNLDVARERNALLEEVQHLRAVLKEWGHNYATRIAALEERIVKESSDCLDAHHGKTLRMNKLEERIEKLEACVKEVCEFQRDALSTLEVLDERTAYLAKSDANNVDAIQQLAERISEGEKKT